MVRLLWGLHFREQLKWFKMFLKFQAFFGPGCQGPRGQKNTVYRCLNPNLGWTFPNIKKKIPAPMWSSSSQVVCTKNGLTNMFRTQFAMCSPPGLQVKLRETSPRKTVPVFRKRGLARTVPHATWPLLPYGSILVHPCVVLPLVQEKTLKTNKQMVTLCTSPSFWDFQQPVSSRCHRCWASQLPFLQLQLCVQFLHLSLRDPLREQSKMAKKITMFGSIQDIKGPDNPNWGNFFQ